MTILNHQKSIHAVYVSFFWSTRDGASIYSRRRRGGELRPRWGNWQVVPRTLPLPTGAGSPSHYCTTSSQQLVMVRDRTVSIGVLCTYPNCGHHVIACKQFFVIHNLYLLYRIFQGGTFEIHSSVPLATW